MLLLHLLHLILQSTLLLQMLLSLLLQLILRLPELLLVL